MAGKVAVHKPSGVLKMFLSEAATACRTLLLGQFLHHGLIDARKLWFSSKRDQPCPHNDRPHQVLTKPPRPATLSNCPATEAICATQDQAPKHRCAGPWLEAVRTFQDAKKSSAPVPPIRLQVRAPTPTEPSASSQSRRILGAFHIEQTCVYARVLIRRFQRYTFIQSVPALMHVRGLYEFRDRVQV